MILRTLFATVIALAGDAHADAAHDRIPAFARRYRTSCSTCHTAAPKLNVMGEAFRLNGYRFPENDALLRREESVPLGVEEWRDEWPRAIWPAELPGTAPFALRVILDAEFTKDESSTAAVNLRFPEEIYFLAGASLGDGIGVFLETEWERSDGLDVKQAKVKFQDVVGLLPGRSLNLWAGMQNLYLFTFADRQIDRAARQNFRWQTYRPSDLSLIDTGTGTTTVSANEFQLRSTQPSIEANGLFGGRFYYGLGIGQGTRALRDDNRRKDFYYKIRYKFGGMSLDGRAPTDAGAMSSRGGQLLDRSLSIEHFGYFGAQPVSGGGDDSHRAFGVNARLLLGSLDLGAGFVWGRNENPWGSAATGKLDFSSIFGKAEVLTFPWLIGSLKFERFRTDLDESLAAGGFVAPGGESRVVPGVIALLRQNVRFVVEGEFFLEHEASDVLSQSRPHAVWLRLDFSF